MLLIQKLNRYLYYIPFLWAICFLSTITIAIVSLGRLPENGIDYNQLPIDCITVLSILPLIGSIFSIPISCILTIYLLIKKIKFTTKDKTGLLLWLFAVTVFIIATQLYREIFYWYLD
jgi:hypothetical protein